MAVARASWDPGINIACVRDIILSSDDECLRADSSVDRPKDMCDV